MTEASVLTTEAALKTTEAALKSELKEIERRRGVPADDSLASETASQHAARLGLTALCLSGGGIRSASFCLGVLQVLASKGLLNEFDYLSTVSGGGFIGGWLQMLIKESSDIKQVQSDLGGQGAMALQTLRDCTNYLTPQTGPFSTDTWAGIALYLRNLILNWVVFAPLFLLAALLLIFYRTILYDISGIGGLSAALLVLATSMLCVAAFNACSLIPSHRGSDPSRYATAHRVSWSITAPALGWAVLVPFAIDWGLALTPENRDSLRWLQRVIPLIYLLATGMGYGLAWWRSDAKDRNGRRLFRENVWRWIFATFVSALLTWIGLLLIDPGGAIYALFQSPKVSDAVFQSHAKCSLPLLVNRETAIVVLAPSWLAGIQVLQTTFYVGFRKEAILADLDREWLARVSAQVLRAGVAWTCFAVCCLVLPEQLRFVTNGTWNSLPISSAAAGTPYSAPSPRGLAKRRLPKSRPFSRNRARGRNIWCSRCLCCSRCCCSLWREARSSSLLAR